MTAHDLGRVLDEIERRLKAQDKHIAALEDQVRDLYSRLKRWASPRNPRSNEILNVECNSFSVNAWYGDLMLAIKEIRSEQKQMGEASVNSEPVNSERKAFAH